MADKSLNFLGLLCEWGPVPVLMGSDGAGKGTEKTWD